MTDRSAFSTLHRLEAITQSAPDEEITLGWLVDQLNERAFGFMLLILALPCCIPFLYGVPQVASLPLLFISAQLALGRHAPWLPDRLRERTISRERLRSMVVRAAPYLRLYERVSRPRLRFLARSPAANIVGLALMLFSASILTPLPLTNTTPGIAVALAALGFLQCDGLAVILGVLLGIVWLSLLIAAAFGLISFLVF
jgi:hypothetical protein